MSDKPRIAREKKTIEVMVAMYCKAHHGARSGLCPACEDLRAYALRRLDRCAYGEEKPTCARCPVHCYSQDVRARVKAVMRYSGPRMTPRHPVLALLHQLDTLRSWLSPPARPAKVR